MALVRQRKGWIDYPRADALIAVRGAVAYLSYERSAYVSTLEVAAVTLTTVAGILLGFGLVVMDRADRSSSRRAQAVFSANRQRVDRNWEIILLMPAAAVVGGLFAVMFGPLAVQWWATVVGYLAAGTGLSAIRMAWFFVVQRELAAVESASKRKEPLRDLASPCN